MVKTTTMKEQEIIVGTPVRYWGVVLNSGEKMDSTDTTITSVPWQLGGHTWVCKVEGIRGCVAISHLEKL
jgi:hypothetical protein